VDQDESQRLSSIHEDKDPVLQEDNINIKVSFFDLFG
jgi:hypothetical protein